MNEQVRTSTPDQPETIEGTLVVIGDLHTSPRYTGTHKNYAVSSIRVLDLVIDTLNKYKQKGTSISLMLLGDTFGVNERNFNAEYFLAEVGRKYEQFNRICEGRVFSVRGNHDMGEYTTFDFAKDMGWLKNPPYIDMLGTNGEVEARMHLVNYGSEHDDLPILPSATNVVFGHNDYTIPGITNKYGSAEENHHGNRILISKLENFHDVSLIVSGHIHTPMVRNDMYATLPTGGTVQLVVPGSPSRVSERIEQCYTVVFRSGNGEIKWNTYPIQLWPVDEEFNPAPLTEDQKEQVKLMEEQEKNIDEIIATVTEGRFMERFDNVAQIRLIPGFSDAARKLAEERYQEAVAAPEV